MQACQGRGRIANAFRIQAQRPETMWDLGLESPLGDKRNLRFLRGAPPEGCRADLERMCCRTRKSAPAEGSGAPPANFHRPWLRWPSCKDHDLGRFVPVGREHFPSDGRLGLLQAGFAALHCVRASRRTLGVGVGLGVRSRPPSPVSRFESTLSQVTRRDAAGHRDGSGERSRDRPGEFPRTLHWAADAETQSLR